VTKRFFIPLLTVLLIIVYSIPSLAWDNSYPLIIDHLCTDIVCIPEEWIDSVKVNIKYHYAHTSHGSQLVAGLSVVETNNSNFSYSYLDNSLPQDNDDLCIFNGQISETYITPELYWETEQGMNETRAVLTNNSELNISMWAWCSQLNSYSESQVQAYLDSVSVLELEFPEVTFVYMTGNAQGTGAEGYNRYLRNEQIRQFCRENNKVLYDFADLDCWYYDSANGEWEFNTYLYEGTDVPAEHPQFYGDEASHTTWESCEQKGKAVWWMMASIAGWIEGIASTDEGSSTPAFLKLKQNYPNPFNPATSIEYEITRAGMVDLSVYDISGRLVRKLFSGELPEGRYCQVWNGLDRLGNSVGSGVYFYKLQIQGGSYASRKMLLIR